MGLETGSHLDDLVITNPLGSDVKSQGDDHIRLIKKVMKATFPGMGDPAWRVQAKSGAYTVVAGDNMSVLNCTAALTLTLTAAATLGNQHMFVVIANGGAITIDPNSSETINGSATLVLVDGTRAVVFCNATLFLAFVTIGNVVEDTTPQLGGSLDTNSKRVQFSEGANVASGSSCNIWTPGDGNTVHITGTTDIDDFATAAKAGEYMLLVFDGVVKVKDSATITVDGNTDFTTAANDMALVYAETTTTFLFKPFRNSGLPVVRAVGSIIQTVTKVIAAATGTTQIPADDTTPVITEGTEIFTQAVTLTSTSNTLLWTGTMQVDADNSAQDLILSFWQGTTIVGAINLSNASPNPTVSWAFLVSPASTSSITYTIRVGLQGATWFVGRAETARMNGEMAKHQAILQEIVG